MTYQINVFDRLYKHLEFVNEQNEKCSLDIPAFENKLFHSDIFTIDINNNVSIVKSLVRLQREYTGVLILEGNKTYGREKNKKQSRLLYKCIPYDKYLPFFLIPYQIKDMGFHKTFHNIYITFFYNEWVDKYPHAKLSNSIGIVSHLPSFYEYQLYCKHLHISLSSINTETIRSINKKSEEDLITELIQKYSDFDIKDRTDYNVFSIDPLHCVDFDDAFSIVQQPSGIVKLSVYIANVTIWLDHLNLWKHLTERISTIYLPDKKRPMLPSILSDNLCSLCEKKRRFAFTLDIFIQDDKIIDTQFNNCIIIVKKNYCYEEPSLFLNKDYTVLFDVVSRMSLSSKFNIYNITNSHDVVEYLMIYMNYYSAKELKLRNTGIFRSIVQKETEINENIIEPVAKMIYTWQNTYGQYTLHTGYHHALNIDTYVHITSPIRRLVDILNMFQIQNQNKMICFSTDATTFYEKWENNIEHINNSMKSIKKIQMNSVILNMYEKNTSILKKEYDVYLFDKIYKNEETYKYSVYIPELKLFLKITSRENFKNMECKKGRLFLFLKEDTFTQKIRLQIN